MIYFIRARASDGYMRGIKIGFSNNPTRRATKLMHRHGVKLDVISAFPGALREERLLHKYFARRRMYGEWFDISGSWLKLFLVACESRGGLPAEIDPDGSWHMPRHYKYAEARR